MGNPISTTSEWTFELIEKYDTEIARIAKEFGLDTYPNQIEVIAAEQMMDAYSSVGMPVGYSHWSFGKQFLSTEKNYIRGTMGLAYEIVINSDPCIAYLMEENTMMMQALVIAHACVDADTEYLSPEGWKRIADYTGGKVGQYTETGDMEFVEPTKYIVNDNVLTLNKIQTQSVTQILSDDHRVVYEAPHNRGKLRIKPLHEVKQMHENKTRGFLGKFLNTFTPVLDTKLFVSNIELQLQVAIIADGSANGDKIRFHLKKKRKIQRLEHLLRDLKIEYVKRDTYGGRINITFTPINTLNSVEFDSSFYKASLEQLSIIAKECLLWDGHIGRQEQFFSTSKLSADFIQYVFSSTGNRASWQSYDDERDNHSRKRIYIITKNNSTTSGISGGRKKAEPITEYKTVDGKSYCFTVPSGMLVLRCHNYIFVTGNCYGHNSFFKNNYLFKTWTNAETIIDYLLFAKKYIAECEERYGEDKVEMLLDSCHSLMNYGVDRYKHPHKMSLAEEELRQKDREDYLQTQVNDLWRRTVPVKETDEEEKEMERFPEEPQENLLYFIEKNAPLLEPWQREIVRIVRKIAQYFYPQRQTQVMNEGWATFTHYTILNKLYDEGLVTDGFMIEFLQSHTNVIQQLPYDHQGYSGLNPYALGFAMMSDIRRICEHPTEEDTRWFPDLVNTDWMKSLDFAMRNFKDESFIAQYLSPKVIRDLKLFSVLDDDKMRELEITAIHDDQGYQYIRQALSDQYNLSRREPNIQVFNVDRRGDRALTLRYYQQDRHNLSNTAKEVMKHLARLWGFTVQLDTEDDKGDIDTTIQCVGVRDLFE